MAKYKSKGITLEYENPAATWNTVGQIRGNLGPPSDNVQLIDVTTHDSTGARMEYVTGLIDSDEMSFELVLDPADTHHEYLRANVGSAVSFRITLTDTGAQTHSFSAIIMGFTPTGTHDGHLGANVTLKRTGATTVVA